jgi:uncharacterized protein YfaP (DUF2135 family)
MGKASVILSLLFLSLLPRPCAGEEIVLFGPKQYGVTHCVSLSFRDAFRAVSGQGTLILRNGSADGTGRVRTGWIRLNGKILFTCRELRSDRHELRVPAELLTSNELSGKLIGKKGRSLTLEVTQDISLPGASLRADLPEIEDGGSTTLRWDTQGADEVTLEPGVGPVSPCGSLEVYPSRTTTYTLTAVNLAGASRATARVTVIPAILLVRITQPADGTVLESSPIDVAGTVNSPGVSVWVNGRQAEASDTEFAVSGVDLVSGANALTAVARRGVHEALHSIAVRLVDVDLQPVRLATSAVLADPSHTRISGPAIATIVNSGRGDVTTPTRVVVFEDVDGDGRYDADVDHLLGGASVPSGLVSGASMDLAVDVSGELAFRDSPLHIMVDSDNSVEEMDEGNNSLPARPAGFDVSASRMEIQNAQCPHAITLQVRVGNAGGLLADAGIPVALYSGHPQEGGVLIGVAQTTRELPPGAYEDVELLWLNPPAGTRSVFARANDRGAGRATGHETRPENDLTGSELIVCPDPVNPEPNAIGGSVRDAVTGAGLAGVTVGLYHEDMGGPGALAASTDTRESGDFKFSAVSPGRYVLATAPAGYFPFHRALILAEGQSRLREDLVVSPLLAPGEVRIVLTWGETPADLEAHLTVPNPQGCRHHCYYWNRTVPGAVLDLDDRDGHGPETITVGRLTPGTYRFYVHDWTNRLSRTASGLGTSGARVHVYSGSRAAPWVFDVPAEPGNTWHVFDLDGATGEIAPIDRMAFQPVPGRIDFPLITSAPPEAANAGFPYSYQALAEDPDPDTLLWELPRAPHGMTVDPRTGLIRWTPAPDQGGRHAVTLEVDDGRCGKDVQDFHVDVSLRPVVQLNVVPCSGHDPGHPLTLSWTSHWAETLDIQPGIGPVPPNGSMSVPAPSDPTLFTITAVNAAGQSQAHAPLRPLVELRALPGRIAPGGSSTLHWRCQCATHCEIDQGIGPVSPQGELQVHPTESMVYRLSGSNAAGTSQAAAEIATDVLAVLYAVDACDWDSGDPVTLRWSSEGATACEIYPGVGAVPLAGSLIVHPTTPMLYSLTATGPTGQHTATVAIPPVPQLEYFGASPVRIAPGSEAVLNWSTKCGDVVRLEPGYGEVEAVGTRTVSPQEASSEYILVVENERKIVQASVSVSYMPPVVSFSANPGILKEGESSVLQWSTLHAHSCTIEPDIGQVPLSGTLAVSPAANTTYTLRAQGAGGTQIATTTVSFVQPTAGIDVSPDFIALGEGATLSWVFGNADVCIIEPEIGEVALGGSVTVHPTWTTTYTITAVGPGGIAVDAATLRVLNLRISEPSDGQVVFRQPIDVMGQVGDPQATVHVNGVEAQVAPDGTFRASRIPLTEGANALVAVAEKNGATVTAHAAVTLDTVTCGDADVPGRFASIQEAIGAASSGQVIVVCQGTYREDLDFLGKALTILGRDGPQQTILRGTGLGPAVRFHRGEGADSVLAGLTITQGRGGISCDHASPTLSNCIVTGNETDGAGGGIQGRHASPLITGCVFSGNSAREGGGMAFESSNPLVRQTVIAGNRARRGGGIFLDSSGARMEGAIIRANRAQETGGGIQCGGSHTNLTLADSLIVENEAVDGGAGGVFLDWSSTLSLKNATVAQNRAAQWPDGIHFHLSQGDIRNSILWDETPLGASAFSALLISHSDVRGGWPGSGNIAADPLFTNAAGGDYQLQAGSPCIDAGADRQSSGRDLTQRTRPIGNRLDMGAYEFYPGPRLRMDGPVQGQVLAHEPVRVFGTVNSGDLTVKANGVAGTILDRRFHVRGPPLVPGENVVTAVAEDADHQAVSEGVTVVFDVGSAPTVRITSPADGGEITGQPPTVSGLCAQSTTAVTINGRPSAVQGGSFTAEEIDLMQGLQSITALAFDDSGTLVGADQILVKVDLPLTVKILSPTRGHVVKEQTVSVRGWVNNGDSHVTVNGTPVEVAGGEFSSTVQLRPGINRILAKAVLGQESADHEIVVFYYVPHSLTVTIDRPPHGLVVDLASPPMVAVAGTVNPPDAALSSQGHPIVTASDGRFAFVHPLTPGTNSIVIDAAYLDDTARAGVAVFYGPPGGLVLQIHSPMDGEIVTQPAASVALTGQVSIPTALVMVNGREVPVDAGGAFSAAVTLQEGVNLLLVQSQYGLEIVHQLLRVFAVAGDCEEKGGEFPIFVYTPDGGGVIDEEYIPVRGAVDLGAPLAGSELTVLVNGVQADVEEQVFSATIRLAQGRNEILVEAVYRYPTESGEWGEQRAFARLCVWHGLEAMGLDMALLQPHDGDVCHSDQIVVRGMVSHPEATVTTNGALTPVDSEGVFHASVPLASGPNSIVVVAQRESLRVWREVTVHHEPGLSVRITVPVDGAIVYTHRISVSGEVSDGAAAVTVNGTAALVEGGVFFAHAVPLIAGINTLIVEARLDGQIATHSIIVHCDPMTAPIVRITEPQDGAQVGTSSILVLGTVEGVNAMVTVNGIPAEAQAGSFSAAHVPLQSGPNTVTALAVNPAGSASHSITVTYEPSPIRVAITSPLPGEHIHRPDVIVEGTVSHAQGTETGVAVNDLPALVYGGRFVANHIPIQEGENVITAAAADPSGRNVETSVSVQAEATDDYVTITAVPLSGVTPLDSTLRIGGTVPFDEAVIYPFGPAAVENLGCPRVGECNVRMNAPGFYYFTVEVETAPGQVHTDTVAVLAMDEEALDALLRSKWTALKDALARKDVNHALTFVASESQDLYREIFTALIDRLPVIVSEMQDIERIWAHDDQAQYSIRRDQLYGGQTVPFTHLIHFAVDADGIWRIARF